MTLSEFLIDIAYDVGKLQAYLYDKEYYLQGIQGLSEANRELLLSGNTADINAALAAENVAAMIRDDGGGHIKLSKVSPAPAPTPTPANRAGKAEGRKKK